MAEKSPKLILCIEDEEEMIDLIRLILSRRGFNVRGANGGKEGLEIIRKEHPDLVLLDLMMPPPDGFAILEALRSEGDKVFLPIVVLTADTSGETRQRALQAGATDFLLKPLDHIEVTLRIRNLLKSRWAHELLDNQRAALEEAVRERTFELQATVAQLQRITEANGERPSPASCPPVAGVARGSDGPA